MVENKFKISILPSLHLPAFTQAQLQSFNHDSSPWVVPGHRKWLLGSTCSSSSLPLFPYHTLPVLPSGSFLRIQSFPNCFNMGHSSIKINLLQHGLYRNCLTSAWSASSPCSLILVSHIPHSSLSAAMQHWTFNAMAL